MKSETFLSPILLAAFVFIATSVAPASSPAAEYTFTRSMSVVEGALRDGVTPAVNTLTSLMQRSCAENLGSVTTKPQCFKRMLNDGVLRNQFEVECKATCEVTRQGLLEITRHQVSSSSDKNICDISVALKMSLVSDPKGFDEPAQKYAAAVCGRSRDGGPSRVDGFECTVNQTNDSTGTESKFAEKSFRCVYSEARELEAENKRVAAERAADEKVERARAVLADLKLKIQSCSANLYNIENEQMRKKLDSFSWMPSGLASPSAKVIAHMTGVSTNCKTETQCRENLRDCQERHTNVTSAQSN